MEILGFNYKRKEICWGDQEKIMLNSHGCWFLTMAWNLQKGCNTILWKFLGEALLCLELPRVKEKFPGFFSKRVCPHAPPPSPSPFGFFPAHCIILGVTAGAGWWNLSKSLKREDGSF